MAKNTEVILKLLVDNKQAQVALQLTEKDVQKLAATLKGVGPQAGLMGQTLVNAFTNAKNVMMGIEQSFSALQKVFGSGITYALQYEMALAKLDGVIKSNGEAAGVTTKEMEAMATTMSRNTMFSKADILKAETLMLTMDNIGKNVMPQVMEAASGMATVMGTDLESAMRNLAIVMESPADGGKKLRSMMIVLTEAEREQIKTLQNMYGVEAAQAEILRIMAEKYGEVNQRIKETDQFKINQMEKSIAALGKTAGMVQLAAMSPLIKSVGDFVSSTLNANKYLGATVIIMGQALAAFIALRVLGITPLVRQALVGLAATLTAARSAFLWAAIGGNTFSAALTAAGVAAKTFWASMGWVGVLSLALSGLITYMAVFGDRTTEAASATDEAVKQIKLEQEAYNRLKPELGNTTRALGERVKMLNDVREKAGLYRAEGIKTEKDLQAAIAETTRVYQLKIEMEIAGEKYKADEIARYEFEKNKKRAEADTTAAKKKLQQFDKENGGDFNINRIINRQFLVKELADASDRYAESTKKESDAAAQSSESYTNYVNAQIQLENARNTKRTVVQHLADPNTIDNDAKRFKEKMLKAHDELLLGEEEAKIQELQREYEASKKFIGKQGITEKDLTTWLENEKKKIRDEFEDKRLKEHEKMLDEYTQLEKEVAEINKREEEARIELEKQRGEAKIETERTVRDAKIEILENQYDKQIALAKAAADDEIKKEKDKLDKNLISYEEYVRAKKAIDEKYENTKDKIEKQKTEAHLQNTANSLDLVAGLFGQQTVAYKAFATAAVVADSIRAAMAAYRSALEIPMIGTFLAPVAAAAAAAYGAKKVAEIQGVKFEKGGFALTGEKGPEIIAPVTTYAQGQAALIEAVTSKMGAGGARPGLMERLGEKMDRMVAAVEAIDLRVDEMGLAVAVNKGNARLGRRQV